MGRSVFEVRGLGGVIDRVMDRVMFIPKGRRLMVNNAQQKIVILLDGPVRALVDGAAVGDLAAGDALVVPGACKQAYVPLTARRETRMHVLIVVFRRGVFAGDEGLRAAPEGEGEAADTQEAFVRRHFGSVQVRRGVLTSSVTALVGALRREATERGTGYRLRVVAHVLLLLTEIARSGAAAAPVATEQADRPAWTVEQVKNFLLERHTEALTLDQVAWHMRLSGEHLARTFRKATGGTIFDYLRHLRIEHAKTLLEGSRFPVVEVAQQCGFSSSTLLVRNFRAITGETPLGYRRRLAGGTTYSPSTFLEPQL